jgi:hypothetical protein
VTLRQQILYAEQMWRNQRLWVLFLVLAGVLISPTMFILHHGQFDANTEIFLLYLPLGLLYGAAMLAYRHRSAVEITPDGVRVGKLLRAYLIPYDLIRTVRVQKLDLHFQDARKRLIRPINKGLLTQNALYIRIVADDERIPELRRGLGSQLMADDMIAIPVPDPDAMSWEITSRLPERITTNLGGQRRRKRAKAR